MGFVDYLRMLLGWWSQGSTENQYSVDSSSVFTARAQGTICKASESPTTCVAKFTSTGG